MVSPKRYQVRIGNIMYPIEDPMNRPVQADPVSSTINFHEYQKNSEHGTPMRKAADIGLSFHQSDKYCALS